ncbi:putative lipid II flippase FtsW [Thermocrispum municipale]|jgi:cell division protein FtsW|uniref:putative lipid II flippase FtsW n=1 Tax=Thermocrispum municipale TaxID=37926 RepID=UPI0003F72C60|nr:putative lipid II flippase FtsW [Thermocrispum municipale]
MVTAESSTRTTRAAGKGGTGKKARGKQRRGKGGRLAGALTALTAWLSRPLASFHLVLAICGLLTVLGIVMVLSASSVESVASGSSPYSVFSKHMMFVCLGMVAFYAGLRLPLAVIRRFAPALMFVAVGLLVLVLTPLGSEQGGTQGWLKFGGFQLQPVEVAKIALALWGAHILVLKSRYTSSWRQLLVPLVPVSLVMFALVIAQPDLGGAVSLGIVLVALLWFAGAPRGLFAGMIAGGTIGVVALALMSDYRLARVLSFLSPGSDASGAGYQANQALYALADGGLFGVGLGQGGSKWRYLPNVQHDFIFALIGEELGFVGCFVVIGLFAGLAIVGLRIATRNVDPWISIVAGTLTAWLVSQACINIGYVVGLLPVTGVTLPLVSYGGTSLVITLGLFGILANCGRHEPTAVAALRSQGPGKFGRLLRLPAPPAYRKPATGRPQVGRPRRPTRQATRRTPARPARQARHAPARRGR